MSPSACTLGLWISLSVRDDCLGFRGRIDSNPGSIGGPMLKKQIQTAMGSTRLPVLALSAFLCVMLLNGCSKAPIVEGGGGVVIRSEEHTSELQSLRHLVC